MNFDMEERKIKILEAIIRDYICTGEPVGSRTIAKKYDLGVSSATIRNEMSDLEEMGFIEQLHTSSGRKPSDKGYRLYVDKLIQFQKLTPEEEIRIKTELINQALYEVDKMVKRATLLLSELTSLTCVVKTPSVRNSYIRTIQLIPIDNNNILAVIVTQDGIINNNIIRVNRALETDSLHKLSNILNSKLKNLTIQDINLKIINDLKNELKGYESIFDGIISALYEALSKADDSEIYCEGAANIFNYAEYNDVEKARKFLALLDNKEVIGQLFNKKPLIPNDGAKISISIGKENFVEDAQNCSIISAVYNLGGKPVGTIGVIGPTRMQYSKVISMLTQFVRELDKSIGQNYFDDRQR
ncbi:heat-inducible transcriptional repressor HrcA [Clostridium ganghwense]|uniref:Heat-inducible transcription repressor HrcA n=1 Tax=Clostridium ganghwense TaxID=312089 RepID=A0ABT4CRY8_9CLOT|nr:heat-inducible transcriptional repressor HrcA [Clostridium ganghwense]MCY6371830.1 heat-inducible transcriptional repressor HrcA [Clostridium ganghwense]